MKIHNISILDSFADDVFSGVKPFEIRENDRGYQTGDGVKFEVVDKGGEPVSHALNSMLYQITYVLSGWGLKNGYVAFGFNELQEAAGVKDSQKAAIKEPSLAAAVQAPQEAAAVSEEKDQQQPIKQRKNSPDYGKIMALHKANWSFAKIADEMGMTKEAAYAAFRRYEKHMKGENGDPRQQDKQDERSVDK